MGLKLKSKPGISKKKKRNESTFQLDEDSRIGFQNPRQDPTRSFKQSKVQLFNEDISEEVIEGERGEGNSSKYGIPKTTHRF
jgi:hypothetical protein